MSLDVTKPVQTRGGLPARIVATDYRGSQGFSIVALILHTHGGESIRILNSKGLHYLNGTTDYDLVNVPSVAERFPDLYAFATAPFGSPVSHIRAAKTAWEGELIHELHRLRTLWGAERFKTLEYGDTETDKVLKELADELRS